MHHKLVTESRPGKLSILIRHLLVTEAELATLRSKSYTHKKRKLRGACRELNYGPYEHKQARILDTR